MSLQAKNLPQQSSKELHVTLEFCTTSTTDVTALTGFSKQLLKRNDTVIQV